MAYRTTPTLGPDVDQSSTQFYWDMISTSAAPSYALGTRVTGSDGYEYVYVKAGSSDINAATQVQIDAGTLVATAGSGGFYTVAAVPANAYFHARKGNAL